MCTFYTDNRTYILEKVTTDESSLDCCSGVFISTLTKNLLDKLYQYTNYDFFFRLRLAAISLFLTYCIHVSSSGGLESSLFITNTG